MVDLICTRLPHCVCMAGTIVFELGDGHKYEGLWKNGKPPPGAMYMYKRALSVVVYTALRLDAWSEQ